MVAVPHFERAIEVPRTAATIEPSPIPYDPVVVRMRPQRSPLARMTSAIVPCQAGGESSTVVFVLSLMIESSENSMVPVPLASVTTTSHAERDIQMAHGTIVPDD